MPESALQAFARRTRALRDAGSTITLDDVLDCMSRDSWNTATLLQIATARREGRHVNSSSAGDGNGRSEG